MSGTSLLRMPYAPKVNGSERHLVSLTPHPTPVTLSFLVRNSLSWVMTPSVHSPKPEKPHHSLCSFPLLPYPHTRDQSLLPLPTPSKLWPRSFLTWMIAMALKLFFDPCVHIPRNSSITQWTGCFIQNFDLNTWVRATPWVALII